MLEVTVHQQRAASSERLARIHDPSSFQKDSLSSTQTDQPRSLSLFLLISTFILHLVLSLSRSIAISKPTLFLKQAFPISFRYFLFLLLAEDTKLSCFLHKDTNTLSQPYREMVGRRLRQTNKPRERIPLSVDNVVALH